MLTAGSETTRLWQDGMFGQSCHSKYCSTWTNAFETWCCRFTWLLQACPLQIHIKATRQLLTSILQNLRCTTEHECPEADGRWLSRHFAFHRIWFHRWFLVTQKLVMLWRCKVHHRQSSWKKSNRKDTPWNYKVDWFNRKGGRKIFGLLEHTKVIKSNKFLGWN